MEDNCSLDKCCWQPREGMRNTAPTAASEVLWAGNTPEPEAQWRWMGHLVPDPPPNSTRTPKPGESMTDPPTLQQPTTGPPVFSFSYFLYLLHVASHIQTISLSRLCFCSALTLLCPAPASPQDVSTHSGYHRLKPSSSHVKIPRDECSVSLLECMMCFN